METKKLFYCLSIALLFSCQNDKAKEMHERTPEIISLLGQKFYEPIRSPEVQSKLDSNLAVAKKNVKTNPSEENYIWYGRREGYLAHYNEAIRIFSEGIRKYPNSYKLYRHRGHRYITIRNFDMAIADFEKAVMLMRGKPIEIEPDGQPNKINKPISSTQFNVWYHLGLAHYLKSEFDKAEQAYLECMKVSDNDDLLVATTDWLYLTCRRLGKTEAAATLLERINESMILIENESYYKRLLLYKGVFPVDSLLKISSSSEDVDLSLATQGYGVGIWYLYTRDTIRAIEIFQKVIAGKYFAAFGYIAAEGELKHMTR